MSEDNPVWVRKLDVLESSQLPAVRKGKYSRRSCDLPNGAHAHEGRSFTCPRISDDSCNT
jgi:hypothetical protein